MSALEHFRQTSSTKASDIAQFIRNHAGELTEDEPYDVAKLLEALCNVVTRQQKLIDRLLEANPRAALPEGYELPPSVQP